MDDLTPISHPEPGHTNFVLPKLLERYESGEFKYVLVLHVDDVKHYVYGMFNSKREALISRCYANIGVSLESKLDQQKFFQVHEKDGPVVELMFDIESDLLREM